MSSCLSTTYSSFPLSFSLQALKFSLIWQTERSMFIVFSVISTHACFFAHRFCLICLFVCRGDTALHKAASEKLHAVCRLLVEAGASLKKTNFQVFTVNDVTQGCYSRALSVVLENFSDQQAGSGRVHLNHTFRQKTAFSEIRLFCYFSNKCGGIFHQV